MSADREAIFTQEAAWPKPLAKLVEQLRYKKDWFFTLENIDRGQASVGLTLAIKIYTPDSYHPEKTRGVIHYFPVPPAAYDLRSWRRWLLEQVLLVERHEAMEFFQIVALPEYTGQDGNQYETIIRPFAPSHGPGNDPYLIREIGTAEDVQTSYLGKKRVVDCGDSPSGFHHRNRHGTACLHCGRSMLPVGEESSP